MRRRRRWIARGIVVVLGVSLLAALVASYNYAAYRSALAARNDLRAAQALLRDGGLDATSCDLAYVEARLADSEAGFRSAREAFGNPLQRPAQHLPLLGGSLKATIALTEIGLEGVGLGDDAVALTRVYQQRRDGGGGPLTQQMIQILEEFDPLMMAMKERLSHIREARDRVNGGSLQPALAGIIRELDDDLAELEELISTYQDLSAFLPDFLGFNGRRTYLVLAQNNAELLPTGGLISVYGVVTVRDGRIEEKRFADAVTYGWKWLERSGAYIEPPTPLKRYLLKDFSWNLAVANWSPHFPTAAQEAERFFRLGGGEAVDGVIAMNVHTIEELLGVTGPVTIESYGVTVSADKALEVIEQHTRSSSEPEGDRKAFVGLLAEELLSDLLHAPPERWTSLIEAMQRLRDQRQLLFFSHDPAMQALSHHLELDGALQETGGDYLMLVDASVHSSKLNIVLEQSIDLAVDVDAQGTASHHLRVSYSNNLPEWSQGRDAFFVQRLMLDGLYGGYVRLLAPNGSLLDSVTLAGREVGPEEIAREQDKEVFGRYFALASGEETELAFRYMTFRIVELEEDLLVYRLLLQKQSGTGAIPVSIQLTLPDGARLHSADLDGMPVGSLAPIETDLAEDRELIVRYRLDS